MEDITLPQICQALAIVAYLCVIYIYLVGSSMAQETKDTIEQTGSKFIARLIVVMTVLSLPIQITGIMMPLGFFEDLIILPESVIIVGSALTVIGTIMLFYVRYRVLGKLWGSVKVQEDHQIIDHGPYGIVRHPLYAISFWIYIGLGLAFPVWWNLLASFLLVVSYAVFVDYEDKFLVIKLPGYDKYKKKVCYRVLPGIW